MTLPLFLLFSITFLELFRQCGIILELFRQCGIILELFRQCGIILFFILMIINYKVVCHHIYFFRMVAFASKMLQLNKQQGMPGHEAWNKATVPFTTAAKVCQNFINDTLRCNNCYIVPPPSIHSI